MAGDDAYKEAKDFMRMLMPSHARHVQQYKDETPVFSRNGVEAQLDAMFSPQVTLKSGGYIVINQTEALVSIDVNSGRATREHSIEDTALNTNMEAAEEIARQLRLRDLAGLIVIDFIDMEEKRNNRSVERRLKDCLRADRARIQVGRISHFGLLEMSRQRIRTGVLESSVVPCPHCRGTGQVRSISSLSLQILRALEDHLLRNRGHNLIVRTRPEVALYVLNQKRRHLAQLEARFGLTISFIAEAPENGAGYAVERGTPVESPHRTGRRARDQPSFRRRSNRSTIRRRNSSRRRPLRKTRSPPAETRERGERGEQRGSREPRRRRRRRRGNGDDRHHGADERYTAQNDRRPSEEAEGDEGPAPEGDPEQSGEERPARRGRPEDESAEGQDRRRRRGRRGGRRRGRGRENGDGNGDHAGEGRPSRARSGPDDSAGRQSEPLPGEAFVEAGDASDDMVVMATGPFASEESHNDREARSWVQEADMTPAETSPSAVPEHSSEERAAAEVIPMPEPVAPPEAATAPEPIEDDRPKRSGWWSRKGFL